MTAAESAAAAMAASAATRLRVGCKQAAVHGRHWRLQNLVTVGLFLRQSPTRDRDFPSRIAM
jgi:hypothetical protein